LKLKLRERLNSLKNIDLDLLDALSLASTAVEVVSVPRGADWVGEEDDSARGVEETSDGVELAIAGAVDGSVDEAITGDSNSTAALDTTASEVVEVPSELAADVEETASEDEVGAASDDAGTSDDVEISEVEASDEVGSDEVVGSMDEAASEAAAKVEVEGVGSLTAEEDA
jgi:hypothetical protein